MFRNQTFVKQSKFVQVDSKLIIQVKQLRVWCVRVAVQLEETRSEWSAYIYLRTLHEIFA